MPYLEPGSGGLRQNHALTGSLFSDIRLELGLEQRQDEVLMGWREESDGGFMEAIAEGFRGAFG